MIPDTCGSQPFILNLEKHAQKPSGWAVRFCTLGVPSSGAEASGTAVGGGQNSPGDGRVCPVVQIFEALLSSEREKRQGKEGVVYTGLGGSGRSESGPRESWGAW